MEQQGDVCGAGSTEKVSSAPWDFSDCSAEVRSEGLTAHVRQRGSWKPRHQWSSLVFRWGGAFSFMEEGEGHWAYSGPFPQWGKAEVWTRSCPSFAAQA